MSSAGGRGMRIAFVGTCQVVGMAAAARRMLPDAEIADCEIGAPLDAAAIRSRIAGFDLIVTQATVARVDMGPLAKEALESHVVSAMFVPPAVFTGFHPDISYIRGTGTAVPAGYGPYHSQIAVGAFMLGLDAERAVRLFNPHVFHRLGYFEAYSAARDRMIAIFARQDLAIAPALDEFQRRRTVFMHTINHPTIELSWRLAALALARAGLADASTPFVPDLPDDLADNIIMPVLPAIARRIGVRGTETIMRSAPDLENGSRDLTLADFVRASLAVYRDTDPAVFALPPQLAMAERLRTVLA